MQPRAVLFDLDGTLVDGADAIVDAFDHAVAARGLDTVPRARVERAIGRPLEAMFTDLVGVDEAAAADLTAAYRARFQVEAPRLVRRAPGADDALRAFDHARRGIVTTKARDPALLVLDALQWRDTFHAVVARDDAPAMKPDPAPVQVALRLLGTRAPDAAMVGDATTDVTAARAAGVVAVGVTGGAASRAELEAAGAAFVVTHLGELPAALAAWEVAS